eukprot:m.92311 g.92311  ORF g.92311 m.92311 type:complete len:194 (+) comp15325_c9_seq3:52-633(+)
MKAKTASPTTFGPDDTVTYSLHDAGLPECGRLLLASTERGLCRISIARTDKELVAQVEREFPDSKTVRSDGSEPSHAVLATGLQQYLKGKAAHPPALARADMDLRGTDFQVAVWQELLAIPTGQTRSYQEIAVRLGKPLATRAVGSACGANPLGFVVPCHRAKRTDGSLGGFAWGLPLKKHLLQLEGADCSCN